MALETPFNPGMTSIPADAMRAVARAAGRTEHTDAPHGGPLTPSPGATMIAIPVFIIARTINEPAALSAHGYTINAAGNLIDITWRDLWTSMPFGLVDPGATKNVRFEPAAVVGDAVHTAQPHRAQGVLYRMPDEINGKSTAMVWLWGLAGWYGCEA